MVLKKDYIIIGLDYTDSMSAFCSTALDSFKHTRGTGQGVRQASGGIRRRRRNRKAFARPTSDQMIDVELIDSGLFSAIKYLYY